MASDSDWVKIRCPACGSEQRVFAYRKIVAVEEPALRQKLFRGELNVFQCVQCGRPLHWDEYLLYSDKEKGLLINVFAKDQLPYRDRICKKLLADLRVIPPVERRPNYLLFGYAHLARMVALIEERKALKEVRDREEVEESEIFHRLFLLAEEWLNARSDAQFEEKFAKADPQFEEGYRLHKAGEHAKATECYHEALKACPNHYSARHNLGLISLHELSDLEGALEAFIHCRELRPNDGGLLFILGRLYFKLNRLPEAAGALRNAVLADPGESLAWYQLGITAVRLGEEEEGLAHLESSLALAEDSDDRAAIESTIQQVAPPGTRQRP